MSDLLFRSMKQKIGSPLDPGGFKAYFHRLDDVAGSLSEEYLQWSENQPVPSRPKITPDDLLRRLQRLDLQDGAAVGAWVGDAFLCNGDYIPLTKTGEREYVIHPTSDHLYTDHNKSEPGDGFGKYHLCITSLLGATSENGSPKAHSLDDKRVTSKYPVPKFVLQIGSLMYKSIKTQGGTSNNLYEEPYDEFLDSGYVAVLDVIDPQKPIWLIYNHFPLDDIYEQSSRDLGDKSVVFPELEENFGAAKVLSSVMDWNTRLTMDGIIKNVKQTMVDVKAVAGGAKIKDLQAARIARKKIN